MVDEDDYPRPDDGLPGPALCIALVVTMPLWLPALLLFAVIGELVGLICELIGRRRP